MSPRTIGVAIDTVYSSLVYGLSAAVASRVLECLWQLGFSLDDEALGRADVLFAGLEEFRQHLGGRLTVTMLAGVGQPLDVHEVDRAQMARAIAQVAEFVLKKPRTVKAKLRG